MILPSLWHDDGPGFPSHHCSTRDRLPVKGFLTCHEVHQSSRNDTHTLSLPLWLAIVLAVSLHYLLVLTLPVPFLFTVSGCDLEPLLVSLPNSSLTPVTINIWLLLSSKLQLNSIGSPSAKSFPMCWFWPPISSLSLSGLAFAAVICTTISRRHR